MDLINNPLFLIPELAGLVFIIAGLIMKKFPPMSINGIYGYRTSSSMKNQETWTFAQNYASTELLKSGLFLAVSGLVVFIYKPISMVGLLLGFTLLLVVLIVLFIRVEKAIKTKFK